MTTDFNYRTGPLSTGVAAIDSEHDEIERLSRDAARALVAAQDRGQAVARLDAFIEAVREHFQREEHIFTNQGHSRMEAHARDHDHILKLLEDVRHEVMTKADFKDHVRFMEACNRLTRHVIAHDKEPAWAR